MRRRLMLKSSAGVSPVLPVEYQQVEWIENTGSQLIETGIPQNTVQKIDCSIKASTEASDIATVVYSGNKTVFRPILYYASDIQNEGIASYVSAGWILTHIVARNSFVNISCDTVVGSNIGLSINGMRFTGDAVINTNDTLKVFSNVTWKESVKINSLTFYNQNLDIIFNALPCYRKSDGVIGMFDTVSQTLFTNVGTGSFTKGADIN